jgi:hypothetical protein
MILIALIARLLDLLTEVFRAMSGRPAFGDPPSQETQPQMRAALWKLTGLLTLRQPRRGSRLRRSCGRGRRSSHPPSASHDHDGRHCGT